MPNLMFIVAVTPPISAPVTCSVLAPPSTPLSVALLRNERGTVTAAAGANRVPTRVPAASDDLLSR